MGCSTFIAGRHAAAVAVVAALLGWSGTALSAQDRYPSRPITMIVPFAAGGSTDVIARVVAEAMRDVLGQPVVIDNRGGAGGSIGTAAIAKADPDGYTIGMGTASTLAINPAAYKSLPYDIARDLKPIGLIASVPERDHGQSVRAREVGGGAGGARKNAAGQDDLWIGRQRVGQPSDGRAIQARDRHEHPACALSRRRACIERRRGRADLHPVRQPADVVAADPGRQAARAGGVVARAARRSCRTCRPSPNSDLDDLDWMAFFGLVAPAKTPQPIIDRLNAALAQALASVQVGEMLGRQQAVPQPGPPGELATLMERELTRMKRAVAAAKIEAK